MIQGKQLRRDQIPEIWSIDRSEIIQAVYYHEHGKLVLKREHFNAQGWPPGETHKYTPLLEACYDRGGWFYGIYDTGMLVAVAVLDSQFIGAHQDQLQLKFLHVSRSYRRRGLGYQLFALASDEARRRGARCLYISATPSENTVDFYLGLGCRLAPEPDPELFELEPEDIHLVCDLY